LLVEQIRPLVMEIMPASRASAPLGADDSLADAGMDSLRMMMLISALQGRFDIVVEEEDLLDENFASLVALASFVDSKGRA
jgi:acyl carrier protein